MNDLAIDPITSDLVVSGFDLSVIQGADRVRQQLDIKLKLFRGEWFLDTEFGTPYFESILGKQITLGGAVAAIKKSILEVNDVQHISSFRYDFDRKERRLNVEFECVTQYGLIRVSL